MYGLVNRAVEGLVRKEFGDDTWERVRREAGVDIEVFGRMERYDDAVTYDLVAAASELLDTPASELLRGFGHYWVNYVGEEGYGPLMEAAGDSFESFLNELDNLHARVAMSYPDLQPPSFRCTRVGEALHLHYHSDRRGLEPMVVGLLEALAERFGETVSIEVTEQEDHPVFVLVSG